MGLEVFLNAFKFNNKKKLSTTNKFFKFDDSTEGENKYFQKYIKKTSNRQINKNNFVVNIIPDVSLRKDFNISVGFIKDPLTVDEPIKPIAPEEEWNRLKHNDTYKTSKERLNNFFDVKEEDNIPACGEQCEIIKEFCYKED